MKKVLISLMYFLCLLLLVGCVHENERNIAVKSVSISKVPFRGKKLKVTLGFFKNKTSYGKGIFSSGDDKIENAALDILNTSLNQSGRFIVMDRENMAALERETRFAGTKIAPIGAKYVIAGAVVEFGRKNIGSDVLLGIVGSSKEQIAYAKVNLNVIDSRTSEIVYSASGAGETSLKTGESLVFGSRASYDSTLTDKVLSLAINNAIDNLAKQID